MLLVVGARVLLPDPTGHADRCDARRDHGALIVTLAFAVGILTGLLANGGGFLLVPAFILILGLSTAAAAGTSLVVAGVLSIPTLLVHWRSATSTGGSRSLFALGSRAGHLRSGSGSAQHMPTESARTRVRRAARGLRGALPRPLAVSRAG